MSREAPDLVFSQPVTAEQHAWLHTTRVPLRSISFATPDELVPDLPAAELTVFADMLACSTHTLQVGPPHSAGAAHKPHRLLARCDLHRARDKNGAYTAICHEQDMIALRCRASCPQVAHILIVLPWTQRVTTLSRFAALRNLSLVGAVELETEKVGPDT